MLICKPDGVESSELGVYFYNNVMIFSYNVYLI